MRNKIYVCCIMSLIFMSRSLWAQTIDNEFQMRAGIDLQIELSEKFDLQIAPQVRFDESMSVEQYLIDGELSFSPGKMVSFGASYRLNIKPSDNDDTAFYGRYGLNANVSKKFNTWKPSLRVAYVNYADEASSDDRSLRYRAKVKYSKKKSDFSPYIAVELFHKLEDGELSKTRYSGGVQYKLNKHHAIGLAYKFDYFLQKSRNRHIVDLAYRISF